MAVRKTDSVIANPKHRGRIDGIDGTGAQSIENEDHDVTGMSANRFFLPRNECRSNRPYRQGHDKPNQSFFHSESSFRAGANFIVR
jgi:hypothetical protein